MADESKIATHTPSALQTLMLAEQFLYNAAQPYEKTRENLIELQRVIQTLRESGPVQGVVQRLSELMAAMEDQVAVPSPIAVKIEGQDVVIRIQCVPQAP